jgi:hypothetical protein
MMFVSVSDDLTNLRHEQDAKLLFEPECTILGYQSCEASILVHWTQNDVCECLGAFRLPSTRKRCKTRFSGPNAIFRSTKVVKLPFLSIRPKMMFGSVSEHFANPGLVKEENSCFGPECNISGYRSCEASILVHWTQNDVWEYLG